MSSDRQVAANRRNAALGSGPKSEQGIAVSRLNARKHGLTTPISDVFEVRAEIEAVTQLIASDVSGAFAPEDAAVLAECHIDFRRIRLSQQRTMRRSVCRLSDFHGSVIKLTKIDRYIRNALSKRNSLSKAKKEAMEVDKTNPISSQ